MEELIEEIVNEEISFRTDSPINTLNEIKDRISKYGKLNEIEPMKVFASHQGEVIEGSFEIVIEFDHLSRAEIVLEYNSVKTMVTLRVKGFYKTIFKEVSQLFKEYYLKEIRDLQLKETKKLIEKILKEIRTIEKSYK
jgi:hypothetical protein